MPFVYDQTEMEWPEDGSEPEPPRADQFVYIRAPDFGGHDPVQFSTIVPTELIEPPVWTPRQPGSPPLSRAELDERRRQAERFRDQRRQQLFAVMVPALQQVGVRRVYCRYDGGNDEGWSWFDSVEMHDGSRIDADTLAQHLHEIDTQERLYAAGVVKRKNQVSDLDQLKEVLGDGWLCAEWATLLLGEGFGTGEYSMYGAFTVDLATCTITDDPHADPVVANITIGE